MNEVLDMLFIIGFFGVVVGLLLLWEGYRQRR